MNGLRIIRYLSALVAWAAVAGIFYMVYLMATATTPAVFVFGVLSIPVLVVLILFACMSYAFAIPGLRSDL